MSTRTDIRTSIAQKIATLVDPGVTVTTWAGEDAAMQDSSNAVYLQYSGMRSGENAEIGHSTYGREFLFTVFVAAEDATATYGDDAALGILEDIEVGLYGHLVTGVGVCELSGDLPDGACETLIRVHAGRYLYAQTWVVIDVESH